jgi:hypothetical protein
VSSTDTIEPITPIDTDEFFIDHLWKQVRSRRKGQVKKEEPLVGVEAVEVVNGKQSSRSLEGEKVEGSRRPVRRRSL